MLLGRTREGGWPWLEMLYFELTFYFKTVKGLGANIPKLQVWLNITDIHFKLCDGFSFGRILQHVGYLLTCRNLNWHTNSVLLDLGAEWLYVLLICQQMKVNRMGYVTVCGAVWFMHVLVRTEESGVLHSSCVFGVSECRLWATHTVLCVLNAEREPLLADCRRSLGDPRFSPEHIKKQQLLSCSSVWKQMNIFLWNPLILKDWPG